MKVLSNTKKERKGRLVGAMLPQYITEFLTLYTLANGITKTQILKPLLEDWLGQQQSLATDEDLLQMIVRRVDTQWKVEKRSDPKLQFQVFKDNLEQELTGKGLKKEYVEFIIKEIE